jgi:ATP-dependent DNA helicase RecG
MQTDTCSDTLVQPLAALQLTQPWQALLCLPSGYTDLSRLIERFVLIGGEDAQAMVRAQVAYRKCYNKDGVRLNDCPAPTKLVLGLQDKDGLVVDCTIFGGTFEWSDVRVDDVLTVLVKTKRYGDKLYFASPEIVQPQDHPRVDYRGVPGQIAGDVIKQAVRTALKDPEQRALAERHLVGQYAPFGLTPSGASGLLRWLHQPMTMREGRIAMAKARQLCIDQVRLAGRLHRPEGRRARVRTAPEHIEQFLQAQPETISDGQRSALDALVSSLSADAPTHVLLNGDVGSGKTLVFIAVASAIVRAGGIVAVLAPTQILAEQLHDQFSRRLPEVQCALAGAFEDTINTAQPPAIWIGTTALFKVAADAQLGFDLVIVDEQHKFAVAQRQALLSDHTHLIEVSATPIPRSLAIAMFDGAQLVQLTGCPVDKQIESRLLASEERVLVNRMHAQAIAQGRKVIYLYPAVKQAAPEADGANKKGLKSLEAAYKRMHAACPGLVCKVHGQMKTEQRDSELAAFRAGEKPILLASTAVEVGIDVPGIALMVVSHPEMFGVAQLHQLRGRLARDGGHADFVMFVTRDLPKTTHARLAAVCRHSDGFALAEADLELRGFGDVASDFSQSGAATTTFKLARLTASDFLREAP